MVDEVMAAQPAVRRAVPRRQGGRDQRARRPGDEADARPRRRPPGAAAPARPPRQRYRRCGWTVGPRSGSGGLRASIVRGLSPPGAIGVAERAQYDSRARGWQALPDHPRPDPDPARGRGGRGRRRCSTIAAPTSARCSGETLAAAQAGVPDRERRAGVHRLGHGGDGVGGAQPALARRSGGRRLGRELRRALARDVRRLRHRAACTSPSSGASGSTPRRIGAAAEEGDGRRSSSPSRRRRPASCTTSRRSRARVRPDRRRCSWSTPSRAWAGSSCATDEWGVDVVVAGSQKALMTPAGPRLRLGLRARLGARRPRDPAASFYLDWRRPPTPRPRTTPPSRPPSRIVVGAAEGARADRVARIRRRSGPTTAGWPWPRARA